MKANVKVKWYGDLAKESERKLAKVAIHDAAEFILQESNDIAPFDYGDLVRSGETDIEVKPTGINASVYYDTPYAARLHEHPEYNFQNGRQGKYLEKTINKNKNIVKEYLISAYKKAFK